MTEVPCIPCGDDHVVDRGPQPVANPAGQDVLAWRAASHGAALERMRAYLADARHPLPIRSAARQDPADPVVALLDSWAVVTDIVSFYTERIAHEGFLRTATEHESVRQLARTLGYELRPGVAARVELAVDVETADGSPAVIDLPAGMPVQTVPAPLALPQIFETSAALEARGAWNAIPAADRVGQELPYRSDTIWLEGSASTVRVDDMVLVVGSERRGVTATEPHTGDHEKWDLRRVVEVTPDPPNAAGWTRLRLDRGLGFTTARPLVAVEDLEVFAFTRRLNLFGWSAPEKGLLDPKHAGQWSDWDIDAAERTLEIDGDVPELAVGSWLALDQPGLTEAYQVTSITPSGAKKFGISGRVTLAGVDVEHNLARFDRGRALVHAVTQPLPASRRPRPDLVGASATGEPGRTLQIQPVDPPLPADRLVLVSGITDAGTEAVEASTVTTTRAHPDGTVTLTLEPPLANRYHAGTVRVRANVVLATHGETVQHVLGSGDGRETYPRFTLRRAPLTHVRSTTAPSGAEAALEIRVEGVAWAATDDLDDATSSDQIYVPRQNEAGETTLTFGDGIHGARLPTGVENVEATYRVGIGADGRADPGQVRLPMRKPRGMAAIHNPLPSRDWAPAEDLDEARLNAPQRIRTLDRAVSVADYADFARGYSGVGRARADLVWNGQLDTVVVSVLDSLGQPASASLLADLRSTVDEHREQRAARRIVPGTVVDVGARLTLTVDPTHEVDVVAASVRSHLLGAFGALDFAAPLASSAVLVVAAGVPGVRSCTMPVLSAPDLPSSTGDVIVADIARWAAPADDPGGPPGLLAAQALRMTDPLLSIEVAP